MWSFPSSPSVIIGAVHFTHYTWNDDGNNEASKTFAATFFAPDNHHPRIGAATVIGRPISPWKKTNHEVLHWDSNWRAPRRMPLQYCAPYWNRPVHFSRWVPMLKRGPHSTRKNDEVLKILRVWKNNYIMKMTVLVLLCILHLSVTVQGKNPKFQN